MLQTASKALYLDLEMACWEGKPPTGQSNRIIQIGIIEADLESLKILREDRLYIASGCEISKYCTQLTGITSEQISSSGIPFSNAINRILKLYAPLNKATMVWGDDAVALSAECDSDSIRNPFRNVIDFGVTFRQALGTNNNYSLSDALNAVGLEFVGRKHDGLCDAQNLWRLHKELITRMRVPFINHRK